MQKARRARVRVRAAPAHHALSMSLIAGAMTLSASHSYAFGEPPGQCGLKQPPTPKQLCCGAGPQRAMIGPCGSTTSMLNELAMLAACALSVPVMILSVSASFSHGVVRP